MLKHGRAVVVTRCSMVAVLFLLHATKSQLRKQDT